MEENIEINQYDINLDLNKTISFFLSNTIPVGGGNSDNNNSNSNSNSNSNNNDQIIEKQRYMYLKYKQFIEYLFENAYANNFNFKLYKTIPPTNQQFVNIKKIIENFKDQNKEMYIACRYDNYVASNYKNKEEQEEFIYSLVVNQLECSISLGNEKDNPEERPPSFDNYLIVYGLIKHNSHLLCKEPMVKILNKIKEFCKNEEFKKLPFDLGHIQLNRINNSINHPISSCEKQENLNLFNQLLGFSQGSSDSFFSFQKIMCDYKSSDMAFTFRYKVPDYKIIISDHFLKSYIDTLLIIIPIYNSIDNSLATSVVDNSFILLDIVNVIKQLQNHYKKYLIEPLRDYMFRVEILKPWDRDDDINDDEEVQTNLPEKKQDSTNYLEESDSDDEEQEHEEGESEYIEDYTFTIKDNTKETSKEFTIVQKTINPKTSPNKKEPTIDLIKLKYNFLICSFLENGIMDLKLVEKLIRDIQLKRVTKSLSTLGRICVPLGLKEFINICIKLCSSLKLQFSFFRFLDMFVEGCQILDPYCRLGILQEIYRAEEYIENEWDPDVLNIEDSELLLDYFETAFTCLYKDKMVDREPILEVMLSSIDKGIAPVKKMFIERKLHHFLSLLPMDYINKYLMHQFYSKIQQSKVYHIKYQQYNDINFNNLQLNINHTHYSQQNQDKGTIILSSYLHQYILILLLNDKHTKTKEKLSIALVSKRFYQNTIDIMNNSTCVPIKILLHIYNVKNIIGNYSLLKPSQVKYIKIHQITTPGGVYSKCLDFSKLKYLFTSVEILKIKGRGSLGFSPKDIQHLIEMKSLKKINMRPLFCQIISNWSDFIKLSNEKQLKFRIHAYAGQSDSFKHGILKDLNQQNTLVKKVATDSLNFLKYYHSSYMQNINSFALHTMADHLVEKQMKAFKENPHSKERLKSIKYIQFMLDYKTNAVLYFLNIFEGLAVNLETIKMEIRTFDSHEEYVFSEIFKTISFKHPSVKRLIIRGFKINDQYITKYPIIINWNLVKLYNFKPSNNLNYIEFERKSINNDKSLYYNSINLNNNNKRNFDQYIKNNNGDNNDSEESEEVFELDEIDSSIAHDIDFFHTYSPNELQNPFKYGDIEYSIKL
ncbi:hypothetical protein DICPUDRAFT_98658 [Dictyostelium purpureum]|uniref:Uncharacterized protein n=1 Tax=Dictyostelium purpureum TaxID=5786 RepID=F0ZSE0_DICPU|nr:uncharacterized protein DICPUDRAFT_98658 [Dictyostelium purpureum]EGC33134.1 hypothetical protein DICPUDRAFT_98658 [Dictyostelium purpureum]|eukprot:XP_003290329.1 hypothetical protein DICPUDRAFT_98658 [Dictyostelium purpureum]